MEGSLNIGLAGDHALNLHALATLLRQKKHFRVVSISKNVQELSNSFSHSAEDLHPHVILLDINFDLHRAGGIIGFLKGSHRDVRLAALGLTKDRGAILRLLQMGVDCYIPKNCDPGDLEGILRKLVRDGKYTTPLMQQACGDGECRMAGVNPSSQASQASWPAVTETERRYFRMAMSEASNEDIRRALRLPESAFFRLVGQVYRHFGVCSRDGLVLALYRSRIMIRDDL